MFHGIKPSLILVFTVVFLSFLPSCGWFEDEKPIKKPQTIKKTIPTILKQTKEQETEGTKANKEIDICQQALKQEKAIKKIEQVSDSLATVVIESNSITNEDSLAKWLKDFTKELYKGTGCILEQVGFSVKIDEFSYFQGIINRGDFGLYKKQKISEAEWVRRFEIKKMATSEALVESLRKARRALDNEKALKLVNQVLDDDFSNVSAREIKANILLDQKLFIEAIGIYETILEQYPDNARVLFNLSFAKERLGTFSESLKYANQLLSLLEDQNKQKDALNQLKLSLDDVRLHLGVNYLKNNELDKAEKTLALIQDKNHPISVILKSNLLRAQNKTEEAKQLLSQLIDTGQHQDIVLYNLVALSLDLKDEKAAKEYYHILKEAKSGMAKELSFLMTLKKKEEEGEPKIETIEVIKPKDSQKEAPLLEEPGKEDRPLF